MYTTIAQQLILFSFSTTIFMLMLVGAIMCLSILRLTRLQRLELAYIQANSLTSITSHMDYTTSGRNVSSDTRPRRPKFNLPATVDIQIAPSDRTVIESPYKPRPETKRKEKIS